MSIDLDAVNAGALVSLRLGEYLYQLQDVAYRRRPFRTTKGRFGIGPCRMLPGDRIYTLLGVDVPYILRPEIDGRLRLVGEAYVHRIMDGEAIEAGLAMNVIGVC